MDKITAPKEMSSKEHIVADLDDRYLEVVVTFGAGDIDTLCQPIYESLRNKYLNESES